MNAHKPGGNVWIGQISLLMKSAAADLSRQKSFNAAVDGEPSTKIHKANTQSLKTVNK